MPSFLTLFLVTRISAGLIFAGDYLFTPSTPVVKSTPTRTTPIFLEPTPCLPSPTSSDAQFPYVVMFGLATVIVASVAFTIWTTFKGVRHPPTAALPPAPDTEPDTEPDITPRDRTRLLSFIFAFFMTICAYVSTLSTPKTPDSLFFGITILGLVHTVEDQLQHALGLMQHLHDYGLQYLKIAVLAIVGHPVGLLVVFTYRRALSFTHHHRTRIITFVREYWRDSSLFLVPLLFCLWHPQLNWSFSIHYYFASCDAHIPNLEQIRLNLVGSLPSIPLATISMILGPVALYSAGIALSTVLLIIPCLPSAISAAIQEVYYTQHFTLIRQYTCATTVHCFMATLAFMAQELKPMGSDVERWLVDRLKKVFFCSRARSEIWELFRPARESHREWRIAQSREAFKIVRLLWTTACSTWEALPWAQKLLVVAPAAAFYSYFYIIPLMDRIELLIRIEYWKYRRRRAVRQFHLNYSAENRLAANN
ncbi:hypothetical protein FB45DRAFT_931646 [Roridomyces roridus]|uniref:Uncharacterized protein n=1 Tax=Roridomyces roridus TaxID=1738132 RepID=A0AAD7BEL0_9AGAR|nr:hypothetical protein FB45DRAFT_931646 [Roridomyces roridus]